MPKEVILILSGIILLHSWLFVSCFVVADWFLRPDQQFWNKHKFLKCWIVAGALVGPSILFATGAYWCLWFIPEGWEGWMREERLWGGIWTLRHFLAFLIAYGIVFLFIRVYENLVKLHRENEFLTSKIIKIARDISRKKSEIKLLKDAELNEEAERLKHRLEQLDKLFSKNFLTTSEEIERCVLVALRDELEEMREST